MTTEKGATDGPTPFEDYAPGLRSWPPARAAAAPTSWSPPAPSRTTPTSSPTRGSPGNPTRSYRTREPVRVVGELEDWRGHDSEHRQAMADVLADLRRRGIDVIED